MLRPRITISASATCRVDLVKVGHKLYKELDLLEDEVNELPWLFTSVREVNRPLIDIYDFEAGMFTHAMEAILYGKLHRHEDTPLSLLRCYFGKYDNVSNFVCHRANEIVKNIQDLDNSNYHHCELKGNTLFVYAADGLSDLNNGR